MLVGGRWAGALYGLKLRVGWDLAGGDRKGAEVRGEARRKWPSGVAWECGPVAHRTGNVRCVRIDKQGYALAKPVAPGRVMCRTELAGLLDIGVDVCFLTPGDAGGFMNILP